MKKGLLLLLTSLLVASSLYAQDTDILRRKYSQISFGKNTIKHDNWKLKSDFAINYTNGRTFYLHEDEVAGMIRFAIDGTWTDFTYAKYTRTLPVEGKNKSYKFNQFDYALNIGPSAHIEPIDDVIVHTYFRYAPAYSLLTGDKQIYGNYATYFVTGISVSYDFIALGFEGRFGNCNYNNIASAKRIEQFKPNPENVISERVKHRGWRVYLSLMF
ncbi:MAG: hypothetical protein J6U73_04335 [Alistipes sp.]|nr:hypothetical protein [Alistipes sp.]